jgi:hypothetical protein
MGICGQSSTDSHGYMENQQLSGMGVREDYQVLVYVSKQSLFGNQRNMWIIGYEQSQVFEDNHGLAIMLVFCIMAGIVSISITRSLCTLYVQNY